MTAQPPVRHPQAPTAGEPLPSHYDKCFGCGVDHPAGLGIELFADEGVAVRGRYRVTANHQGAPGIAHGGILAAVMDELLGSLNWLLMAPAVTYRLETVFRRPVPVDTVLQLSARVVSVDGAQVLSEGEGRIGSDDGPVAVRATGEFRQVPAEHFRRHGRPEDVRSATGRAPWRDGQVTRGSFGPPVSE
jgi:acyl-coenzyme A thioesterase PaaI-like protein